MKANRGGKDLAKKFWYIINPVRFSVISEGGISSKDVMVQNTKRNDFSHSF